MKAFPLYFIFTLLPIFSGKFFIKKEIIKNFNEELWSENFTHSSQAPLKINFSYGIFQTCCKTKRNNVYVIYPSLRLNRGQIVDVFISSFSFSFYILLCRKYIITDGSKPNPHFWSSSYSRSVFLSFPSRFLCFYYTFMYSWILSFCYLLSASHLMFLRCVHVDSCRSLFNFNSYIEFHCTFELVYLFSGSLMFRFFQPSYYKQ